MSQGSSPTPSTHWYDRRPAPVATLLYDENFYQPLGNGDFIGQRTSIISYLRLEKWGGTVNIICIPISGNVAEGAAYQININTQYANPGTFVFQGDGDFLGNELTCSLSEEGLAFSLANMPACVAVITYDGEFVARIFYGTSSQVDDLAALPIPFSGAYADGRVGIMDVESDGVYLSVEPAGTIKVFGFNLADSGAITPFVEGDEASSGVDCDVVGGEYGIEVTMPDVSFDSCWLFRAGFWLQIVEI